MNPIILIGAAALIWFALKPKKVRTPRVEFDEDGGFLVLPAPEPPPLGSPPPPGEGNAGGGFSVAPTGDKVTVPGAEGFASYMAEADTENVAALIDPMREALAEAKVRPGAQKMENPFK